jgi:predicted outer membrane repeat protein
MVSLLEPRVMLSAVTVNTSADNTTEDAVVTLREAVAILNDGDLSDGVAGLGGRMLTAGELAQINISSSDPFGTNDTVLFDASTNGTSIVLGGTEIGVTRQMAIRGNGAQNTVIDGDSLSRIFTFNATGSSTVDAVTLTNGQADGVGGAIRQLQGTLSIERSFLTENESSNTPGIREGGAVHAETGTTLNVTDSTFSLNIAHFAGGAIKSDGIATITNSTFSGNTAPSNGGAISGDNGSLTLTNVTMTANSSAGGGGIAWGNGKVVTIRNSIIAGNTDSTSANDLFEFSGPLIVSSSLIGTNVGTGLAETGTAAPDGNGNYVGGSVGGAINPMLAGLADNGGPTPTHALLAGSLALNSGSNTLATNPSNGNAALTTDQRGAGFPRIAGGTVDMGAFELGMDFGDAPNSYGTLSAQDGAQHLATGPTLGATRDSETDGQPPATATLDANGDGADDDGVTFHLLRAGQSASIVVNVANAPSGAFVDAWIDFNHDGGFDVDEKIAASAAVVNGNNTLTFNVPAAAIAGATFARIRLSTAGGLGATGAANDGEVEDYRVVIYPSLPAAPLSTTNLQFSNSTPTPIQDAIDVGGSPNDDTPVQTTAQIVVAGMGTYLHDLNVLTFLRHTYNRDIGITITSPSGTVVTLINRVQIVDLVNIFNGTVWDDQANPGGQVPYSTNNGLATDHVYQSGVLAPWLAPSTALGAFIGENPNGTWTITVTDHEAFDVGVLDSWTLDLTTLSTAPSTVENTFTNTTPVSIASSGTPVVTSTLNVSGIGRSILDVNLQTFLRHTFARDIDMTLTSPSGRVVTLTTDNGAGNDNVFNGTVWDDDAATSVTNASYVNNVPLATLIPEEALAAFLGEDPNGTWTLTISDDEGGDGGSLDSWSLTFRTLAVDFGDAPAGYPVTLAENGAAHLATGITLGATRDSEGDGTHSADASADGADEDGVTFPATMFQNTTPNITVNASGPGFLNAWADFNRDGDFDDAGEQFATNLAVAAGNNLLPIAIPNGIGTGNVVMRFRLTSASVATPLPTGFLPDGEVEDYRVAVYAGPSANPVIQNFGTGVAWTEGQPPVLISGIIASVTDTDSPNFDFGSMTVTLTNNAQPGDLLSIRNQGTGIGQIGVMGNTITYRAGAAPAVVIGTFTGGTNGQPLVITFNSTNATLAAVSALLKNLTFSSTSDNPTNAVRTVRVQVADGDSGTSAPVTKTISVTPVNDSSTINNWGGQATFTEDGPRVFLDTDATVTDPDSADFANGVLLVHIITNGQSTDQLGIGATESELGNVSVVGNSVRVNDIPVGTVAGGLNGSTLSVVFNMNATAQRVSAVLQAVQFWNTSHTPSAATRTIRITVNDGDAGSVQNSLKTVAVVPVNDAPVIGGVTSPITFNGTPLLPFPTATLTDLDSTAYNLGTLTIQSTNGATGDLIDIRNQGILPGQVNIVNGNQIRVGFTVIGTFTGGAHGAPLVISLNANASIANVQALMRNIRFTTSNLGSLPRTLNMTLQEADGTLSNTVSQTINGNVPE